MRKMYLTILLGLVLCLTGWTAHAQLSRGTATPRQTWEYKTIVLTRSTLTENFSSWFEDGKPLPSPVDGAAKLRDLGEQGWELVAVDTISDAPAGGTTRLQEFFKRPK